MSLTVDEINQTQFNTKMRGYNQNEVNDFIQEVSQTVQSLTDQVRAKRLSRPMRASWSILVS